MSHPAGQNLGPLPVARLAYVMLDKQQLWDLAYLAARREHVYRMRREGRTFRDIGEHMGISAPRAKQLYDAYVFGSYMRDEELQ
jgi:uncharacterized protein YerC